MGMLDLDQKIHRGRLVGFHQSLPMEEKTMAYYQDPNAGNDAPVKRQILMVLAGFAVGVALIAVLLNIII